MYSINIDNGYKLLLEAVFSEHSKGDYAECYTLSEASQVLGVPKSKLYWLVKTEQLPAWKDNGKWYMDAELIDNTAKLQKAKGLVYNQ